MKAPVFRTYANGQIGKFQHIDGSVETWKVVKFDAANNQIDECDDGTTAGGDDIIGVTQSAVEAGQPATVHLRKSGATVKVIAGVAIAAGTKKLSPDDGGNVIAFDAARVYLGVPTAEYIASGVAAGQVFDMILLEVF